MDNRTFNYAYSARRQAEVNAIRDKYLPKNENKMEQLRRLDRRADRKGSMASLVAGVIGCLMLGLGMCCTLQWGGAWFVPGIVIGVTGIVAIAVSYPLYRYVAACERERIAPQVLQLVDELSDSETDDVVKLPLQTL